MVYSLCVRQCGKNLAPDISFDFLNYLSTDTVFVPHFTEEETEARQGDVTSLTSQSGGVAEPGFQQRSEQPEQQAPCLVCLSTGAFGTTPSVLQLQDNLPFISSLPSYLFLHSSLRYFPIWISCLRPHSPHPGCEPLGGESTIFF